MSRPMTRESINVTIVQDIQMNISVTQKLNGATYVTYHSVTMIRRGVQNAICGEGIMLYGNPVFWESPFI